MAKKESISVGFGSVGEAWGRVVWRMRWVGELSSLSLIIFIPETKVHNPHRRCERSASKYQLIASSQ